MCVELTWTWIIQVTVIVDTVCRLNPVSLSNRSASVSKKSRNWTIVGGSSINKVFLFTVVTIRREKDI